MECPHYNFGWTTTVDVSSPLGQTQADYIRKKSGRSFKEERGEVAGSLIRFLFDSGQKCFREHSRPVDRDPIFKSLIPGRDSKLMDYDEFFTTFNEASAQRAQKDKEV